MAPSPEHDKEQKPPDKTITPHSDSLKGDSKTSTKTSNQNWEPKPGPSNAEPEFQDGKDNTDVETLDDGQLRALLDEAITYKNPKDREGKSLLFKELLEEVEQDEESGGCGPESVAAWRAREARGGSRRGRRGQRLPHSGSLQDLVAAALAGEPVRRPRAAVSARALHGGSLPSGVDTYPDEHYIATVRCVNPPPLTPPDIEMEFMGRSKAPRTPVTYTTCATLEIGAGGHPRAVTTTTSSSQIDSGIPFGCITSPAVVPTCSSSLLPRGSETSSEKSGSTQYGTVKSDTESGKERRDKHYQTCVSIQPSGVIATNINGLATISRASYSTAPDENKKSIDENGNSLTNMPRVKTQRRKKVSKNETVAMSEQIVGYQGNKELDELLRFIESNPEQSKKGRPAKHHDDDKASKKRSTERRKDKHEPKRANSMEELSLTKLEDLTGPANAARKVKKHSVGDAEPYIEQGKKKGKSSKSELAEEGEFQTVTKRKRGRKPRRAGSPPLPARPPSARSLPPPASSASYADMAKLSRTIPDLIESCNPPAATPPDPTPPPTNAGAPPDVLPSGRAERRAPPSSVAVATPPPVTASAVPPPVILSAEETPNELAGITFGFDINHQLLQNGYDIPNGPPPLSSSWEFPEISSGRGRRAKSGNKQSSLPSGSPPSFINGLMDNEKPETTALDLPMQMKTVEHIEANNNNSSHITTALNSSLGSTNSTLGSVNSTLGSVNSTLGSANSTLGSANSSPDKEIAAHVVRADLALAYRPPRVSPPTHRSVLLYVANAWEDIIRSPSGKVRYYTE